MSGEEWLEDGRFPHVPRHCPVGFFFESGKFHHTECGAGKNWEISVVVSQRRWNHNGDSPGKIVRLRHCLARALPPRQIFPTVERTVCSPVFGVTPGLGEFLKNSRVARETQSVAHRPKKSAQDAASDGSEQVQRSGVLFSRRCFVQTLGVAVAPLRHPSRRGNHNWFSRRGTFSSTTSNPKLRYIRVAEEYWKVREYAAHGLPVVVSHCYIQYSKYTSCLILMTKTDEDGQHLQPYVAWLSGASGDSLASNPEILSI